MAYFFQILWSNAMTSLQAHCKYLHKKKQVAGVISGKEILTPENVDNVEDPSSNAENEEESRSNAQIEAGLSSDTENNDE